MLKKSVLYKTREWNLMYGADVRIVAGCSKRPSSKAAASKEARRCRPHFVWPFARRMDLGERKIPSSASEPLSEARTTPVDFFSILLIA
jgi:hypothetical protein